jgi:diguanylate cyclase (GGDEF)-like protein
MALSCNRTCALSVAERIRDSISARPIQISGEELIVTSSLGVAVSCAGVREDAGSLIAAADEALYRAKNGGRNRVECAVRDESDTEQTRCPLLNLQKSGTQQGGGGHPG